MTMLNASSAITACHADRLRRRNPLASMSSSRPTMTSEVRAALVSVPGTTSLNLCSRSCQSGLNTASTSDTPMQKVSRAATAGIQVSRVPLLLAGGPGLLPRSERSAEVLSVMSDLLSGPGPTVQQRSHDHPAMCRFPDPLKILLNPTAALHRAGRRRPPLH